MPFVATWMDLEIITLSKVSQKESWMPYSVTCMWNLKYDINKLTCEKETDSQTEQTCGCWGQGIGLRVWD